MRQYGIIGYPIAHSFSPKIHQAAYQWLKINAEYKKIEIEPSQFKREIKLLKSEKWAGFNVTIPYKELIFDFIDELDPVAESIGAVNTIAIDTASGKWKGYNTDYNGFLNPIRSLLPSINICLILGAGGAARAVAFSLISECNTSQVIIVNRTEAKAKILASRLTSMSESRIEFLNINDMAKIEIKPDIIINTTSLGMGEAINQYPADPSKFCHDRTVVYDLIYNPAETSFLKMAREAGLRTINGLPMLIGQAAFGFEIMTGKAFPEPLAGKLLSEFK